MVAQTDGPHGSHGEYSAQSGGGSNEYKYKKQYLAQPRPVRVIIIGAGLSGIAAVKIFKDRFADDPFELVIYEKNDDVTGTWLENRYPGCSCDVPAHAYTFSWEGNPHWSRAYVGAVELFDYFKGRAIAYGVNEFVRLRHRVVGCKWDDLSSKWSVKVEDLSSKKTFVATADVVINACGFLNNWKWPEIAGLQSFEGHLAHSARWDDSYSFKDKRVAVIGSGSSGIQIVPKILPVVHSLVSFNRSATWIVPEFAAELAPEGREQAFSESQKQEWAQDPKAFREYRKMVDSTMNKFFELQYKHPDLQKTSVTSTRAVMEQRLAKKPQLVQRLVPNFSLGCRRITPGHGYLEALSADNVTVCTDEILRITRDGIEAMNGSKFALDAIICATGFDTSFRPFFPVIGVAGRDLRDDWADEPRSYLSVAAAGYPNYFMTSGPNFPLANGCLIPCLERCVHYAFDAVDKLRRQNLRSMTPSVSAVADFQEHKDSLMEDLVWTSGCRSWYKNGHVNDKVWGPWPGSSLHFLELMAQPRWEDWEFKYFGTGNRFSFLGKGITEREDNNSKDLAWYIDQ
ncbi:hypothetical protein LTS10_012928 [Elasticomyces elasticus]|nr:hypothetical protein LTS10_012928 [Elasticomyces elasticus]